MEMDFLREYVELARCLNYSRTAEKMHVTQPTLSKHVVSLERAVGSQLLKRDRHSVELTEAGRIFASAAEQAIEAMDDAQMKINDLAVRTPIRVDGILYDSTLSSVIAMASTVLQERSQPSAIYEHREGVDFVEMLDRGEIDIALAFRNEADLKERGMKYVHMTRSHFVAMVGLDHPLAKRKEMHIEDLKDQRLVKLADSYAINGWWRIEQVCRAHGFVPKSRVVMGRNMTNYATVPLEGDVMLVNSNLPQLRYLADFSQVKLIPVDDEDAVFRIYAIYKESEYDRVKPVLDAYEQARAIMIRHGQRAHDVLPPSEVD